MDRPTVSRRGVVRGAVALGVGSVASAGVLSRWTDSAAAATVDGELLAEDVRVERNDGRIDAVTVAPTLSVRWRNYGEGVEAIDLTVSAAIDDEPGFDVLYDGRIEAREGDADEQDDANDRTLEVVEGGDVLSVEGDPNSIDGTATIDADRRDLTARGDAVTVEDFGGNIAADESATTTVELTVRVDVIGRQGESETALETVTFDVTVHNPAGEAGFEGEIHPDAT